MDKRVFTQSVDNAPDVCLAPNFFDDNHLTARDVMRYGVVSVEREAPVHRAVSLLLQKNISGLPVTHEEQLVGILSDKDLLKLLYESSYLPGKVIDYMTPRVVSFDVEARLSDISFSLIMNAFRRIPILHENKIAGMITRADLLRAYRWHARQAEGNRSGASRAAAQVGEVMNYGLVTVAPDALLEEAMDLIVRHHITGLPVVDQGKTLLGIITEKDLLLHICNPKPTENLVEDLMTREVISFHPQDSLNLACACLIEHDFHLVPIAVEQQFVGLVTRQDILKHRVSY